ncbi:MAG TPA: hypothetical protein VFA60_09825 [Terriglobales bacterium]|nr:hypothetical protein [Terriglobales bacterium]
MLAALFIAFVLGVAAPAQDVALASVRNVPPRQTLPLSEALVTVALHLQDDYVLFGLDIRGEDPTVNVDLSEAVSLGTALAQIVGQARGYTYEVVSAHVVSVYPVASKYDPADVMNLHIAAMKLASVPAYDVFGNPGRFIPELQQYLLQGKPVPSCGSIGPGLRSAGPGVSVEVHSAALRDVLNDVAVHDSISPEHLTGTYPVGWIHRTRTVGGKTVHEWSALSTVRRGWEQVLKRELARPKP